MTILLSNDKRDLITRIHCLYWEDGSGEEMDGLDPHRNLIFSPDSHPRELTGNQEERMREKRETERAGSGK